MQSWPDRTAANANSANLVFMGYLGWFVETHVESITEQPSSWTASKPHGSFHRKSWNQSGTNGCRLRRHVGHSRTIRMSSAPARSGTSAAMERKIHRPAVGSSNRRFESADICQLALGKSVQVLPAKREFWTSNRRVVIVGLQVAEKNSSVVCGQSSSSATARDRLAASAAIAAGANPMDVLCDGLRGMPTWQTAAPVFTGAIRRPRIKAPGRSIHR